VNGVTYLHLIAEEKGEGYRLPYYFEEGMAEISPRRRSRGNGVTYLHLIAEEKGEGYRLPYYFAEISPRRRSRGWEPPHTHTCIYSYSVKHHLL
jgi:hypothetical protein